MSQTVDYDTKYYFNINKIDFFFQFLTSIIKFACFCPAINGICLIKIKL
jgi:hypothetical protein